MKKLSNIIGPLTLVLLWVGVSGLFALAGPMQEKFGSPLGIVMVMIALLGLASVFPLAVWIHHVERSGQ